MKLTAPSIRTWDPPETRAVTRALDCYGCKTSPMQNLRHSWIKTNHDLADAYAKRIGLMK